MLIACSAPIRQSNRVVALSCRWGTLGSAFILFTFNFISAALQAREGERESIVDSLAGEL